MVTTEVLVRTHNTVLAHLRCLLLDRGVLSLSVQIDTRASTSLRVVHHRALRHTLHCGQICRERILSLDLAGDAVVALRALSDFLHPFGVLLHDVHGLAQDFRLLVLVDDLGRHVLLLHLIQSPQKFVFLIRRLFTLLN